MKTFNKHQSFKGVNRGGSNDNRRDFNKPTFGGNGGNFNRPGGSFNRGNAEMFPAVCADCGKTCEVPFRPNGKKPVYCKDCFGKNGGQSSTNTQNFPHKSFAPQNNSQGNYTSAPKPYSAPSQSHQSGGNIEDMKKQIEVINIKIDRLMNLMSTPHVAKTTPVEAMKVGAVVAAVKAKVASKPAPKKVEAKKKVAKKPVSKKK